MSKNNTQKLVTNLWYAKGAEEAARFYTSVFPDSRIDRISTLNAESPSGPPGSVKVVELTVCGHSMLAMEAGEHHPFNDAMSIGINCDTQAELDRYWNAILEGGGTPTACGWIIDRWGVRWQIVPTQLQELMTSPDREAAKRAAEEMLTQVKLDMAAIQAAFDGTKKK